MSSSEDLSDVEFNDDEWLETETNEIELNDCLFCNNQFTSVNLTLDHCKIDHNFDLILLSNKHGFDSYSYIKLINYIRKLKPTSDELMTCNEPIWNDDVYLKPEVIDPWLMFDFEFWFSKNNTETKLTPINTLKEKQWLTNYENQLKEKDESLQLAMEQIKKLQTFISTLIAEENSSPKQNNQNQVVVHKGSDYFEGYAHYGIHHQMLADEVRTQSYHDAIMLNRDNFKEKLVLDLGCGTSILSMFSAKAGARKVYGVDNSNIIYDALDIIRENGLEQQIELKKETIEEINFENNLKFDIIVSEWMGYFLMFEGMLDSVIYARDKFLKPNGLLLPNKCTLKIVASNDLKKYKENITFWDNVYGFKMSSLKKVIVKDTFVDISNADNLISTHCQLMDLDLYTCTLDYSNFETDFNLEIIFDGQITSFVTYFDVYFDLPNPVSFSTSPLKKPTHWKQTIFYLNDPLTVKKGQIVFGKLKCRRDETNSRALKVLIDLNDTIFEYNVN